MGGRFRWSVAASELREYARILATQGDLGVPFSTLAAMDKLGIRLSGAQTGQTRVLILRSGEDNEDMGIAIRTRAPHLEPCLTTHQTMHFISEYEARQAGTKKRNSHYRSSIFPVRYSVLRLPM